MARLAALVLLVTAASASSETSPLHPNQYERAFSKYKKAFNRSYSNPVEELARYDLFHDRLQHINEVNVASGGFQLAPNQATDRFPEEIAKDRFIVQGPGAGRAAAWSRTLLEARAAKPKHAASSDLLQLPKTVSVSLKHSTDADPAEQQQPRVARDFILQGRGAGRATILSKAALRGKVHPPESNGASAARDFVQMPEDRSPLPGTPLQQEARTAAFERELAEEGQASQALPQPAQPESQRLVQGPGASAGQIFSRALRGSDAAVSAAQDSSLHWSAVSLLEEAA